MAQSRKVSTTKRKKRTLKKKKSKVYIPTNSIIIMCAIVAVLCTILLLVNTISSVPNTSSGNGKNVASKNRVEKSVKNPDSSNFKTKEIAKSNDSKKSSNENKVTSNPEKEIKRTEKKSDVPKKTQKEAKPEKNGKKQSVKTQNKTQKITPPENKSQSQPSQQKSTRTNSSEKSAKSQKSTEIEKPSPKKEESTQSSSITSSTPSKSSNSLESKSAFQEKKSKEEKIQKEKSSSSNLPAIPPAVNGARIAIIFDDGGQNLSQLEKCVTLPFPVTVAVLPRLSYSRQSADRVRSSGNELMLHQPMQSVNQKVNPGAGAIKPNMSEDEIRTLIFQNIRELSPVSGVNNHEGSLITANAEQMSYVMKACSDEGVFFLDSRTNVETKVPYVAAALGYSYYERNIFLDNQKNRANILNEILKGLAIANKKGVVIMIGHVWSAEILPEILRELYPVLREKGYKFTTVSNSGAMITP